MGYWRSLQRRNWVKRLLLLGELCMYPNSLSLRLADKKLWPCCCFHSRNAPCVLLMPKYAIQPVPRHPGIRTWLMAYSSCRLQYNCAADARLALAVSFPHLLTPSPRLSWYQSECNCRRRSRIDKRKHTAFIGRSLMDDWNMYYIVLCYIFDVLQIRFFSSNAFLRDEYLILWILVLKGFIL